MEKFKVDSALLKTHCRWELSTNFVKMVATNHKLPNLNVESLNVLSYDCTYRLFMVVDYAKKIANQSKRKHLKESDIMAALKILDYDDLYGCNYSRMGYQLQTASSNVGSSQTVGGGVGGGVSGGNRTKGMLTYVDKEFDLESFLSQPPLKLPREILIHEHWLSINSVVPDIPENIPQLCATNVKTLELAESTSNSFINYHHQVMNVSNYTNLTHGNNNPIGQPLTVFSDKVPLLIERQLIYKELTEACFGQNENKKKDALNIMSTDLVMKELTPHFACFIRETTKINVKKPNLGILLNCVRMIKAIFDNIHLKQEFMQNHLHYFVPALLNCIVSRRMCVRPDSENHWALRCFASKTAANICTTFQNSLPSLSLRVCNVAKRVIECCQTLPSNEQCLVNTNSQQNPSIADVVASNDNFPDDIIINEEQMLGDVDGNGSTVMNDPLDIENNLADVSTTTITADSHNNTSSINIDSIPFSSYYGAVTLLFDMGVSVVNLTLLPLFPKLSQLIDLTLQSDGGDSSSHQLAKFEANHLKELLIKLAKYIITSNSLLRGVSEDVDEYCNSYGKYLGPFIFRELVPIRNPTIQQHSPPPQPRSPSPTGEKQSDENKHVL